ncbi:MAG: Fe-S cluster assembly ATPase SufC [Deltaproteobacteria bacterium]|nr:Fe-S cluster assembly ATPase SufC [Deltaproteobacteria bacterium]
MPLLEIEALHVEIEGKKIINGLDLTINPLEVHALMGPNGSGKSTLSYAIMGHPKYKVTGGDIRFDGVSILNMPVDERARLGIFLGFQYPMEVSGVSVENFLRTAAEAKGKKDVPILAFHRALLKRAEAMSIPQSFLDRYLNEGFSGGEKKRNEVLQMAVLVPRLAVLDEIDSGLDIDALRLVAEGVNRLIQDDHLSLLVITHYQRILEYIKPGFVHIMVGGRIVRSGGHELAQQLDKMGYEWVREA